MYILFLVIEITASESFQLLIMKNKLFLNLFKFFNVGNTTILFALHVHVTINLLAIMHLCCN